MILRDESVVSDGSENWRTETRQTVAVRARPAVDADETEK